MSTRRRIAFVTCSELAEGSQDDALVIRPLAAAGADVTFVTWDDPDVDWARFDLVVLRSTWDYPRRIEAFLRWAATVTNLANPLAAVRWSSDKRYLAELAAAGVPSVRSLFVEPGAAESALAESVAEVSQNAAGFVVKPAVGAGSIAAGRYPPGDDGDFGYQHAATLLRTGRTVVFQPYLVSVDHGGETSLVYVAGELSHAVHKKALLTGPVEGTDELFKDETIASAEPTDDERAVGAAALAAAPLDESSLLYARVDLLAGPGGDPTVLELELIEPSLFMQEAPGAHERFAAAIVKRCRNGRSVVDSQR